MLICACNQAKKDCEKTCSRWNSITIPDKIYHIPAWPKDKKDKKDKATKAVIAYANRLDWPKKED